jgi:hypothetical protein
MIKFRSKHVCTPSARKFKPRKPRDKVKVVAVERLPIDYIPEIKAKRVKKAIQPTKYSAGMLGSTLSDEIAKSTKISSDTSIPGSTIVCGYANKTGLPEKRKILSQRKVDRITTGNAKDFPINVTGFGKY